jgi:hypothetical protein
MRRLTGLLSLFALVIGACRDDDEGATSTFGCRDKYSPVGLTRPDGTLVPHVRGCFGVTSVATMDPTP